MVNRPENQWIGGDFIKLKAVAEELRLLGVEVDIFEMETLGMNEWYGVESYDIVHTWNFSMLWSKYAIWLGGKKKKKLVSSMIYHDTDVFIDYKLQQVMMDHMDACIYETESEIERVKKHLTPKNSHIIPNGVDSWWFEPDEGNVPFEGYVLTVGRIEPNKGQLATAEACRELGLQYVCIGEITDQVYAEKCLAQGAMLYPAMTKEKLKRWYKNCAVYAQVSKSETWGMAVDEAGTQGARLVLSTGFERQDIPDAVYCDHDNTNLITQALQQALSQPRGERFKLQLKKRTWKKHAQEILKIYKEILKQTNE